MEMFDEVKVVYVPDNQQLIEIVDRRQAELEWTEAQICFINLASKWEIAENRNYALMRECDDAEDRLVKMFIAGDWAPRSLMYQAWSAYRYHLLYHTRAQS